MNIVVLEVCLFILLILEIPLIIWNIYLFIDILKDYSSLQKSKEK